MSLCGRNCDLCNLKLHCQGCSLCEMPFCRQDCHRCFSLCPQRQAAFSCLKRIGGGEISLLGNHKLELPVHIPVLPDRLTEKINVGDIVGVHGGRLLSTNGENVVRVYKQNAILEDTLNLPNKINGVLQFYVKDRTLEGLWDNRNSVYEQLKTFRFAAVIAPNFSVYEDAPRMDHLYNIKRSSIIYNELIEKGFPAVPDISWYNRIDLDQWIREINKSDVKAIAFSFQTVSTQSKASNTWRHYLLGYHYLVSRIPEDTEIIVAGIVSPERLASLRTAGKGKNRISVLNQTAYVQSRRGILSERPAEHAPDEISKNEIFVRNIAFYDAEYERLNLGGGVNA